MRAVVQRVSKAEVTVEGKAVGSISKGCWCSSVSAKETRRETHAIWRKNCQFARVPR